VSRHRLLLTAGRRERSRLSAHEFLWRPVGDASSFRTDVSPGLDEFAGVRRPNVEFVRLAVLAYLVDRTTPRPRNRWLRHLDLDVPVWDPDPWNRIADDLATLLGFLTSDHWSLTFRRARTPRPDHTRTPPTGPVAMLFSGGADSLAGAIIGHDQHGRSPILTSHRDWPLVTGQQNLLVDLLDDIWADSPTHASATVGRNRHQLGSGEAFGKEPSSRARSLLFIAFGLAVAEPNEVALVIPENGFASLNPPMGGERRGALSTRTTHPWYLDRLQELLGLVDAHADLHNPFEQLTKSEMFRQVAAILGDAEAAAILSQSGSCARGDNRYAAVPDATHCGVCFGCLVRRAAFRGADLKDHTIYVIDDLATPLGAHDGWYGEKRARDLQAVRYAARRGVDPAALVATLPARTDPADAVDTARRGLDELAALVL
jgi:7-cyano-7-deazaguanine synthase in queuosine biosynthesis